MGRTGIRASQLRCLNLEGQWSLSSHFPPLSCKQVKQILKNLGFEHRPGKATSHEQWVREDERGFFKVTVDCPKQPFTGDLVKWMARQANVTKKEFYAAL